MTQPDLRTLAVEALWAASPGASGTGTTYRELAEVVLAAVLPEHEQQVAARERLSCWETLTSEARAWEATAIEHRDDPEHGDGDPDGRWANLTAQGYWSAANKLIPPNDVAAIRRLAAAAPPATPSAPVPAGTAPAVPEDGRTSVGGPYRVGRKVGRTIYRMAGDQPSDTDELIGVMDSPALAAFAVRGMNADTGQLDLAAALTYAEMEAERDRLARELYEAQERIADYDNRITWDTTCGSCAAVLDGSVRETERAEKAEAARDRLAAQVEELRRYAEEHRQRLLSVREAPGEPGEVSQISISVDEADVDTLRTEVRRLDHRLRWAYRHSDNDATASMLVAYELADQRDRLAAQVAQFQRDASTGQTEADHE